MYHFQSKKGKKRHSEKRWKIFERFVFQVNHPHHNHSKRFLITDFYLQPMSVSASDSILCAIKVKLFGLQPNGCTMYTIIPDNTKAGCLSWISHALWLNNACNIIIHFEYCICFYSAYVRNGTWLRFCFFVSLLFLSFNNTFPTSCVLVIYMRERSVLYA